MILVQILKFLHSLKNRAKHNGSICVVMLEPHLQCWVLPTAATQGVSLVALEDWGRGLQGGVTGAAQHCSGAFRSDRLGLEKSKVFYVLGNI